MDIVLKLLMVVANVFLGSWFISYAVDCFKRERYFGFGLHIMLAIWEVILLARTLLMA